MATNDQIVGSFNETVVRIAQDINLRAAPGGLTGQFLTKASGTDYDFVWATGGGGGGGGGDVYGPATNTADYLPQWNGANSKTLKNGRAIGVASATDIPDRAAADTRYQPVGSYAPLASPAFTGTPAAPTATAGTSTTQLATTAFVTTALALKANLASPTFTGTVGGITAAMVGLGNVTNTSDANKPVSTAQQTALDLKANILDTYNLQTGTTYTLQASDAGKIVDLANASAITVTIPNSLAVGFNCIIAQSGAGQVTVAAGSGATLTAWPSGAVKTAGQWAKADVSVRTNAGGTAAAAVMGGGVV